MKRSRYLFGTAMAVAVVVGMYGIQGVHAKSEKAYVSKAKVTTLVKGPLVGVAGKEVVIKHFVLPPKFVGGKHWHPGAVFVYVLEGEFTVDTEDGLKTFKAGQLYQEPPKKKMRAKNLSATGPVKILVFQVGDAGKPMMVKAK